MKKFSGFVHSILFPKRTLFNRPFYIIITYNYASTNFKINYTYISPYYEWIYLKNSFIPLMTWYIFKIHIYAHLNILKQNEPLYNCTTNVGRIWEASIMQRKKCLLLQMLASHCIDLPCYETMVSSNIHYPFEWL